MNPFLSSYTTPHGVPPFKQIEFAHFAPAFAEGFAEQTAEYEAIEQNWMLQPLTIPLQHWSEVVRHCLVCRGCFTVCWEPIQPKN